MKKNNRLYSILFLSIFLISTSCIKEAKRDNVRKKNTKILDLIFPDTVILKNNSTGEIIYNMKIDTLKKSEISDRFLFLYVTTDRKGIDILSIKETNYKTFIDTIGNGVFHFKAYFNNKGNEILNLVFEDVIMTNKLIDGKIPIYKKYTTVSLPVYVIEH